MDDSHGINDMLVQDAHGFIWFDYGTRSIKTVYGAVQKRQIRIVQFGFDRGLIRLIRHDLRAKFGIAGHG